MQKWLNGPSNLAFFNKTDKVTQFILRDALSSNLAKYLPPQHFQAVVADKSTLRTAVDMGVFRGGWVPDLNSQNKSVGETWHT